VTVSTTTTAAVVPPFLSELVDHRSDHDDVLAPLAAVASPRPADAVVVPTSRGAGSVGSGLSLAAAVAHAHGCPLIVLVSADAATKDGLEHIGKLVEQATGGKGNPTYVPVENVDPSVFAFRTDSSELCRQTWGGWPGLGDTALKRNLALLLAMRERWNHLLFLDDDIIGGTSVPNASSLGLDVAGIASVMGALADGWHAAVGWAAVEDESSGYADNSMVCRIRRRVGFPQGVFMGGGALAVRVDPGVPHFARIYNEDWLFCIRLLLREGRAALALAGAVTQDQPDVVFDPDRALMEEPGDILAETLMNVAREPRQLILAATDEAFWRAAVLRRTQLVHDLLPLLHEGVWTGRLRGEPAAARTALTATVALHDRMVADLDHWSRALRDFVQAWLGDSVRWTRLLRAAEEDRLPPALSCLLPSTEDLRPR
jgi:hypothetical protein